MPAPQTEDEIYEEVRSQLGKIMLTDSYSVSQIERESTEVSEYSIADLARQAGFRNTAEFLQEWYDDLLDLTSLNSIRAYESLYDTPELQHIISLTQRTQMKKSKGSKRGGRGGGRGGRGRGGLSRPVPSTAPLRQAPPSNRRPPPSMMPASSRLPPSMMPSSSLSRPRQYSPDDYPRSPMQRAPPGVPRRPTSEERIPPQSTWVNSNRGYVAEGRREPPYYAEARRESPVERMRPQYNRAPSPPRRPPPSSMQNGTHSYAQRSAQVFNQDSHGARPPPGFEQSRRNLIQVDSRNYDPPSAPVGNYHYDDEDDPFGVNTARTHDDHMESFRHQNGHHEPAARRRVDDFYDDDGYSQQSTIRNDGYAPARYNDYAEPPRRGYEEEEFFDAPEYHHEYRQAPPPREYYDDDRNGYDSRHHQRQHFEEDYEDANFDANEMEDYQLPHPQSPQRNYHNYDHHLINGATRSRNGHQSPQNNGFHEEAIENLMELPPCRTFPDSKLPVQENHIKCNDYADISAQTVYYNQQENIPPFSSNFIDYYFDVMLEIHSMACRNRNSSFYVLLNNLDRELRPTAGFDALSVYAVAKALTALFKFSEDYISDPALPWIKVTGIPCEEGQLLLENILKRSLDELMPVLHLPKTIQNSQITKAFVFESKQPEFQCFVKLQANLKDEKDFNAALNQAELFSMDYTPVPFSLCVYLHDNDVRYRARVIGQIDDETTSIELVDVGEFLTVDLARLCVVESDLLASKPRFAIPCKWENPRERELIFETAEDGFRRRATNKSVSMALNLRDNYVSMVLK